MNFTGWIVIAVVITAFILLARLSKIASDDWNRRWPPISEDEFMERLPPGTDRSVALRTRLIIAEQLGVEYDQVYPEQNFVNDLGCD